jgi:hypothetical protein
MLFCRWQFWACGGETGTDVAKAGNAHNLEGELSGWQFFLFFPR